MPTPIETMKAGCPHAVEPIAVVGIGCRMPGNVRSASDLWTLLMSRGIVSSPKVPPSRFNIDAYFHPNNERPGSFNVPGGYFLEGDPYDFNPGMFNISPIEAMWMDPQQRILLEVVYEALENSGTPLDKISGRKVGCFVGSSADDAKHLAPKDLDFSHAYMATGVDPGIIANRVNYVFNLTGPSLLLNAACSSSLYALDLACKSMSAGECDGAIVGGTNLILDVGQQMGTANLGTLSPTNQCHAFDACADGYGRAEGAGALYLKPLSAAIRDGDPVRAVIRSTASGSNGRRENGLAHPSKDGQVEVIKTAYRLANLSPGDTSYVECHGTGTPVGDPIEVRAVHESIGVDALQSGPILIGSVKPNVGHSEAASSMGTLIKAILALENEVIPPTAGVTQLNPDIAWDDLNVQVVTEPTSFPVSKPIRRIGVNAFGYGGTNAHAILESADSMAPGYRAHKLISQTRKDTAKVDHYDLDGNRAHLLVFSSHDEMTLKNNLTSYSVRCQDADLVDLAYTFGTRRTLFSHRVFAVAHKDSFTSDIAAASTNIIEAPKVPAVPVYVFTGQGAQWPHMGVSLIGAFPSVLQTIRHLDEHLSTLVEPPSWKIETVMMCPDEANSIDEPEFAQPLCTALQIAIVDLLDRWGLRPVATVGHSSGEMAAAYAAGLVSAESAIASAYYRGKSVALHETDGAMLSVNLSPDIAKDYIRRASYEGRVDVSCHNSPNNTTLSGDRGPIEQLKKALDAEGIFAQILQTSGMAYHSHHMKDITPTYKEYLAAEPISGHTRDLNCPMFSTVQLKEITKDGEIPYSSWDSYWVENLASLVSFHQAVQLLLDSQPGANTLIEIGPHSALAGPLKQICQSINRPQITYLPSLKREHCDADQILRLAGDLWSRGADIDLRSVTSIEKLTPDGAIEMKTGSLLVDLPPYHWAYSRYWPESRLDKESRETAEPRHDLLGRRIIGTSPLEPVWRNILRQRDVLWLSQHTIAGEVSLPATAYLAIAIEAIAQLNSQSSAPVGIESYTLRDVVIHSATVIPDDDKGTEVLFQLQPIDKKSDLSRSNIGGQWYQFTASCCTHGSWKTTAEGHITLNIKSPGVNDMLQSANGPPMGSELMRTEHKEWLKKLQTFGVDLGPVFQHISDVYVDVKSSTARCDLNITQECGLVEAESRYVLHPGVMHACLQPLLVSAHKGRIDDFRCSVIPTHFREVTLFPPSAKHLTNPCSLECWTPQRGNRAFLSNSQLTAHDGSLIAQFSGCRNVQCEDALANKMPGDPQRDLYLQNVWKIDSDYMEWAGDIDVLATTVEALLHKVPTTKILCLERALVSSILTVCPSAAITVSSLRTSQHADETLGLTKMESLSPGSEGRVGSFGLVVCGLLDLTDIPFFERIRELVSPGGHLLFNIDMNSSSAGTWEPVLKNARFSGVKLMSHDGAMLTSATETSSGPEGGTAGDKNLLIVYRDVPTSLLPVVIDKFSSHGWNVRSQSITSLDLLPNERVILLADMEGPFLAQLNEAQLKGLIHLTHTASAIAWVSCGGLLSGDKPEFAMTEGFARVIRNEIGSLDLVTLDFDAETTLESSVANVLVDILTRQKAHGRNGETEYYMKGGVVYVSRITSSLDINREFVPDSGETMPLPEKDSPAVCGRFHNGDIEFYRDHERRAEPLGAKEVEVHVAAMGITALDGSDDATYLNHQIAGTVNRIGSEVIDLQQSTSVFGFALDHLATFQRTSPSLLQTLPEGCSLLEAASLPSPFTTALYVLEDLARVELGDSIVIVDDIGDICLAMVQVCRLHKANPIVVTSSPASKEILLTSGMPSDQIIDGHSDDSCISAQINKATAGNGVNIVLYSSATSGEIVTELGHTVAPFGRVVALGSSRDWDREVFYSSMGRKGISYSQFDLTELIRERPQVVTRLLSRCASLYSQGKITGFGRIHAREPREYCNIVRSTLKDLGPGIQVLSYDKDVSFNVVPTKRHLKFKPDVTYLLIGGLGGIGQKVAAWMADRGAEHLAFLSRSGTDRPAAKQAVEILRSRGVTVSVLRGDVTSREELANAISQIDPAYPIRGVMNAAADIRDRMFSNMTFDIWYPVTQSKLRGCQNLHELFKDQELDFFVMTSSITALLGSTGQSSYGAANGYLDSLARHRRLRDLPAVSIELPAIFGFGYIHENSAIRQSIEQKGMYGISEREMLDAFEIAMTPQNELPPGVDHIAVGIQPRRFGSSLKKSGSYLATKENPCFSWLDMAMEEQATDTESIKPSFTKSENIMTNIRQAPSKEAAIEGVTKCAVQRLARLTMINEDQIETTQKSIADYGLDSMIGAEFRNWIFREFGVNMPFKQLLAETLTLSKLAETLCEKVCSSESNSD
ncbi:ketoacyl-synt-domain-containing protein [Hypoxylon trugodes]|uniref:ketoacyl-synt-domain-containing protein n=1 Tax=Hypoxylon trugodes TaxID=326681 RepID=UPI0021A0671D|nr:ketoacyl-synt-domain-containing protein [Hypoxylon trugodes]KAI1393004.1 ketoacyl-synt-domain-containing protein [Hypoxylon trugodes]